MQIKIYFNEKPVFLCDEIGEELNEIIHHPDAVFIEELSTPAINSLLHEIKKDEFHAGVILNKDLEKLKHAFFKHFQIIEAAGGIVQNDLAEILFIFRRGKWDLPKGKLEEGEDIAACAQREVEEETGAANLQLVKKVGETYHTYVEFGKDILKITYWYQFLSHSSQELIPQAAEDISEARWVNMKNVDELMDNSYQNIRDILSQHFALVK